MENINADVRAKAFIVKVNKIRDEFCSDSTFDLIGHLLTHANEMKRKNKLVEIFLDAGDDLALLEKEIASETASLNQLQKLSGLTKNKLCVEEKIVYKRTYIKELTETLHWLSSGTKKRKRHKRSDAKPHIYRIASIFYEMTGNIPDCTYDSLGGKYGDNPYFGKFYDFLLSIKVISEEIGIELPKSNQTLGKYASEIIRGFVERQFCQLEPLP